jgi:hypothetical protein
MKLDDSISPWKVIIYRGRTLGGKKPGLWAGPTSHRRIPSGL